MTIFLVLWLVLKIRCIEELKKIKFRKMVKRKFRDSLIRIALTFDTPVSLSFFLNIRDRTFAHALDIVSFISAVLVMLLFIIVPIYFGRKIIKNKHRLEDEEFKEKYGGLYRVLKTESNWSILYYQFFILRRLILAAAVIFGGFSVYF